jgi:hypothetical protein
VPLQGQRAPAVQGASLFGIRIKEGKISEPAALVKKRILATVVSVPIALYSGEERHLYKNRVELVLYSG